MATTASNEQASDGVTRANTHEHRKNQGSHSRRPTTYPLLCSLEQSSAKARTHLRSLILFRTNIGMAARRDRARGITVRRNLRLTGRSSGRQHRPCLRHFHGQCWCPPPYRAPAPLTLGVRLSGWQEHSTETDSTGMKRNHLPAQAKLKPSFKMCLVFASVCTWIAAATYAETPPTKQSGTTAYVAFLSLFLGGMSLLSSSSSLVRGFVFSDGTFSSSSRSVSVITGAYSLSLLAMYIFIK